MGDGNFASKREGRSPVTGQIQAAQQELSLADRGQGTGAGGGGGSPKGAILPLLAKAGAPPSLIVCTLCPKPLPGSPHVAPLLSSPAVLPWLLLSADRASLGSVQIVPWISPLLT